ncbi:MAG: RidA family protein [Pseudomonadota bacterium]
MTDAISARLGALGIVLPTLVAPAGNYVPTILHGGLLWVSGQIAMADGVIKYAGALGDDCTLEDGVAAARLCGINIIAQAQAALGGDLSRVTQVVRLNGLVQAAPGFTQHPTVINGASDLMVDVFGDAGRHTRTAVGMSSLPLNTAVEIDAILAVAG